MESNTWEVVFDGTNTKLIQNLVGRMQNMDGDVDQARFYLSSPMTPELGGYLWVEDTEVDYGDGLVVKGRWHDVEVGDTISEIGRVWVPKYGHCPVLRVRKG